MRVQHNIAAMNAYRNFSGNTKAIAKNLEKLSSGYRINRAGDDAAGLAISEKMRAQITGLNVAQKNAKDGISLVQTAEGALTEVHSMLNRMFSLAEQSANGTYDNEVDRANLQKEFGALREEIDRIADASNFNGQKLLDGSLTKKAATMGDVTSTLAGAVPTAIGTTLGTTQLGAKADTSDVKAKFEVDLSQYSLTVTGATAGTDGGTFNLTIGGQAGTATDHLDAGNYDGKALATAWQAENGTITIDGVEYTVTDDLNGKLTFEQTNLPSVDGATANGNMTVVAGATLVAGGTVTPSGDVNDGATIITAGHVPEERTYANTSFTLNKDNMADGNKLTIGDQTFVFKAGKDGKATADATKGEILVDLSSLNETEADYVQKAVDKLTTAAASNTVFSVGQSGTAGQVTLLEKAANTVELDTIDKVKAQVSLSAMGTLSTKDAAAKPLTLQIGDTADSFNVLSVEVNDMHAKALGLASLDIGQQGTAQSAMDSIKNAINSVSSTRGDLGALQNRLEHTINNLGVMEENIQDAEATIRDTDVAQEMMAYTKNNILVQSAQAMLAQANQLPQGVLQLLG